MDGNTYIRIVSNSMYLKRCIVLTCISVFQAENSQPKAENQRRERSDAICKLLGDYLLKGYKMLASTCSECDVSISQLFMPQLRRVGGHINLPPVRSSIHLSVRI